VSILYVCYIIPAPHRFCVVLLLQGSRDVSPSAPLIFVNFRGRESTRFHQSTVTSLRRKSRGQLQALKEARAPPTMIEPSIPFGNRQSISSVANRVLVRRHALQLCRQLCSQLCRKWRRVRKSLAYACLPGEGQAGTREKIARGIDLALRFQNLIRVGLGGQ
jgi:hypothetical protein